jgi:hypothetical protein
VVLAPDAFQGVLDQFIAKTPAQEAPSGRMRSTMLRNGLRRSDHIAFNNSQDLIDNEN